MTVIRPLQKDRLREQFATSQPFPFLLIDDFFEPEFARDVAAEYPSFDRAAEQGRVFESVNEHLKLQITDAERFPPGVRRMHDALASPEFLADLSEITGIDGLLADAELVGGGMHQTGARGRLDVHVDFNYVPERALHRRLNILVYLNTVWEEPWGGYLELWDPEVKARGHSFAPKFNRCVIFETSEISYHGVTRVTCPTEVARKSFAAYYYTREAPAGWDGRAHDTVFRARPDERLKGCVWMPLERARHRAVGLWQGFKRKVKRGIGAGA